MHKPLLLPTAIELETSTFCNRRCKWCPNSVYSRSTVKNYIEEKLFIKIINELSEIGFSGYLSLHNYNEPLLDPNLLNRIDFINKKLDKVKIVIVTNGDYLNNEIFSELLLRNVHMVRVTLYDGSDNLPMFLNRIDCISQWKKYNSQNKNGKELLFTNGKLSLVYFIPNISTFSSRGGIIKVNNKRNISPFCLRPFERCIIDYAGRLKMCCEVFPDDAMHCEHGIIGDLNNASLLSVWFGAKFNQLRKNIILRRNDNPLCSFCKLSQNTSSSSSYAYWEEYLNKYVND